MSRLVIETPCDHDEVEPHVRRHAKQRVDLIDLNGDPLPPEWIYTDLPCPGGSRTVLTEPDYEAAHAVLVQRGIRGVGTIDSGLAHQVVNAALFGGGG